MSRTRPQITGVMRVSRGAPCMKAGTVQLSPDPDMGPQTRIQLGRRLGRVFMPVENTDLPDNLGNLVARVEQRLKS